MAEQKTEKKEEFLSILQVICLHPADWFENNDEEKEQQPPNTYYFLAGKFELSFEPPGAYNLWPEVHKMPTHGKCKTWPLTSIC